MDEDALFAHLEELMGKLPQMEREGERLAKARGARLALEEERSLRAARILLSDLEASEQEATARVERLKEQGASEEDIVQAQREMLYWAAQKGFRVAPVQNGEKALAEALERCGCSTVGEAAELALPDDGFAALERSVESFQRDYAETLAACEAIEGDEAESADN